MAVPTKSLAVIVLIGVLCAGCPGGDSSSTEVSAGSASDCGALEPENPYADGSGHYAGFEWAERNERGVCGGNSASFIEGCHEFLRQAAAYRVCVGSK